VVGLFPPPDGVGLFVIFVDAFNCFWFAGLLGFYVLINIAWFRFFRADAKPPVLSMRQKIFHRRFFRSWAVDHGRNDVVGTVARHDEFDFDFGQAVHGVLAAAKDSVWPFCRPKPLTSLTVIPSMPISPKASWTSSA